MQNFQQISKTPSLKMRTNIKVLKPLYGIPEAETHWRVTYIDHHKHELQMESST